MVDSNDRDRIGEAKEELNKMLSEDEMRDAILLVPVFILFISDEIMRDAILLVLVLGTEWVLAHFLLIILSRIISTPKSAVFGPRKVSKFWEFFGVVLVGHLYSDFKGVLWYFWCVKKDGVFWGSVKYVDIFECHDFESEIGRDVLAKN